MVVVATKVYISAPTYSFTIPAMFPSSGCATTLISIWLKLPTSLRLKIYKVLRIVGEYLYGPAVCGFGVQRLPLNPDFMKYGHVSRSHYHPGELRAMQYCSWSSNT